MNLVIGRLDSLTNHILEHIFQQQKEPYFSLEVKNEVLNLR